MMKKKVIIISVSIILCVISFVLTYFVTLKIDMLKKGGNVDVKVTFDDTESYVIPSIKKMDKETALKEWPYKITVNNSGTAKGLYQIIIEDISNSIKRDDLDYVLFLDEKEIKEGHLKDISNNILYTYGIDANTTQKYDLYIWSSVEQDEKNTYEYKLTFNTIKDGGPGF